MPTDQQGPGEEVVQEPPDVPFVSVCVVTGARHEALGAMLRSLRAQADAPPFEVLVCGTADPDVAAQVIAHFPKASVGLASGARLGGARNYLLSQARGEWLYFLDDDVILGPKVLHNLAELALCHPEAGVFGGPNDTPPGSTRFQGTQGAVLGSLAGSGPVRRRYTPHCSAPARERDLILCNLAVKREAMVPFDASLTGAEENGLLSQLARRGVQMRYEPDLAVYHDRRPDLGSFTRQMHKYGYGRGQLIARSPRTLRAPYLLPVALIVYLALLPELALLSLWAVVPLGVYLTWNTAGAAKVALGYRRARPSAFCLSVLLLPLVHVAYGAGVMRGTLAASRAPAASFRWLDAQVVGAAEVGAHRGS